MRERLTINDVENEAAREEQLNTEAGKISQAAEKDFGKGANTYEYRNRTSDYQENAGRPRGLEKEYAERLASLLRSIHPDWEITLVEVIGHVATGRDESEETHDGYDLEISKG